MRVSLSNLLIIGGALIAAFVAMLLIVRLNRWRRDLALRQHGAPVLVIPITSTPATPPRPLNLREPSAGRTSPSTVRRITPTHEVILEQEVDDDIILVADSVTPHRGTPIHSVADIEDLEVDGTAQPIVRGGHVRSHRAEEGTLEFLPGRLEIVAGGEIGQEIHFLRQVGEDDATITFGRSTGPPLRHVQLLDPTVSRQHARLSYTGGHWHLTNLSHTNPVTLNGTSLPADGHPMTLGEGDRVEMGAVVFIFHDR